MGIIKRIFSNKELLSISLIIIINRLLIISLAGLFLAGTIFPSIDTIKGSFTHFDSLWYLDIADNGYDTNYPVVDPSSIECNMGTNACQRNFAFFPLYPITIKLISWVFNIDSALSGIILSNLFFIIASLLFYYFVKEIKGKRIAMISLLVLLNFPVSYLFSGVLSESLFFLLLISTIYLCYKKKWILSSITGLFLGITRNIGILVIIPLIIIYTGQNKGKDFPKMLLNINKRFLLSILMIPTGLIIFMIYLNNLVLDPIAFITIQKYWEKPVNDVSLLLAIPYSIINYFLEGSLKIHLYNLMYFIIFISISLWGFIKKKLGYSLLSILLFLFIPLLSGSMLAISRYIIVLFPIYILIAMLVNNRKILTITYLILSIIANIVLLSFYVKGYWISV
jgi:Gpi18-like mannosyltransferase